MTTTSPTIPRMGRRRKLVDQSTYSGRVAVRLRELRERAGKTVPEMETALGLSRNAYYAYENARAEMSLDTLHKIATILGVPIRTLLPKE